MITLETLRAIFGFPGTFLQTWAEFGAGEAMRPLMYFVGTVLPAAAFQYLTLRDLEKWYFRWLPLMLLAAALVVGEIQCARASGWEDLGWAVLTAFVVLALLGSLLGAVIWQLCQRKKIGS